MGLDLGTDFERGADEDNNFSKRDIVKRNTSSVIANTPVPVNPTIYTNDMVE